MLTRFSNDRDPFADPPHTRQDLERLAADARARVPVPYPSTTTAGAGAGNDAKALVTLVPVAIHGLLVLGPAWSMISHGGADHSDTATESESLVSSVAGGGNSADALDRSRSSDPMDLLLPVVPSGLRFMTGAAILGLTLSWFDPLSAKAFGDSISIALALVVDDLLHDPRQISQKWTEFPIVAKSAVSEAFSIPHQAVHSLQLPLTKHSVVIAEFHLTGSKKCVSLGYALLNPTAPPSTQPTSSTNGQIENARTTPLYRGSPRLLFGLATPLQLPSPVMIPIPGAALTFGVSVETMGVAQLESYLYPNTFVFDINPVYPVHDQVTLSHMHLSLPTVSIDTLESKLVAFVRSLYARENSSQNDERTLGTTSRSAASPSPFSVQEKRICFGLHNGTKMLGKLTRVFPSTEQAADMTFDDVYLSEVFVDPSMVIVVWLEYQIHHTWVVAAWSVMPTTQLPHFSESMRVDLYATPFLNPDKHSYVDAQLIIELNVTVEVYELPPSPTRSPMVDHTPATADEPAAAAAAIARELLHEEPPSPSALLFDANTQTSMPVLPSPPSQDSLPAAAAASGTSTRSLGDASLGQQVPPALLPAPVPVAPNPNLPRLDSVPALPPPAVAPEPVIDPSVLFPQPEPHSLLGLSRAHLARLLSARFPVPNILQPTSAIARPSLVAEIRDERTVHCVSLVFLAYSPSNITTLLSSQEGESGGGPTTPAIRLEYSFFTFPQVKSDPIMVVVGAADLPLGDGGARTPLGPAILKLAASAYDGYFEQYSVDLATDLPDASADMSAMLQGPGTVGASSVIAPSFVAYLATASLCVTVVDARTQFIVGRAHVPLSALLRQGRPRACAVEAVPVCDGTGVTRATLYVGLQNTGESSGRSREGAVTTWAELFAAQHATTRVGDYRQLLARRTKVATMVAKLPPSMIQVDSKLAVRERQERMRCLVAEIQDARERRKYSEIVRQIKSELTSSYHGHVMFGSGHFFEFYFTNPRSAQALYVAVVDDPNMRVITSAEELESFLPLGSKPSAHRRNNQVELLLHPNEAVSIPIVYSSLERLDHIRCSVSLLDAATSNSVARLECAFTVHMHAVHSTVTYLAPANDYFRKTISLDALMGIRPSISTATSLENNTNNAVPQVRAVRCLDSDVSCALELPAGSTATGNGGQMVLRARVPRQVPAVRTMYIYTYRDAAAHRLASVTAVTLRSAQRVDLVGYLGQTTRVTLMVSGAAGSSGVDLQQKQLGGMVGAAGDGDISSRFTVPTTSSRQVVCYSSAKSPIVSVPSGVFGITIGSGGSQEVPVTFSPDAIGEDTVLVHLVDAVDRELVWSWVLKCHAHAPIVTKSFQLTLPLFKAIAKRISFTNPYAAPKSFRVTTSHKNLVSIREETFDVAASATVYLHLLFATMEVATRVDLYIFVNDMQGNSEECFCVQARFGETA